MAVDLRKIKKLIELVEDSDVQELEVRDGEECIRITRAVATRVGTSAGTPAAAVPEAAPEPAPTPAAASAATFAVRSPMAGTFYRAPAPGADPFVRVGQVVTAGEVVCIIESMKMMNEIKVERGGVCTAVVVENGHPVGSGDVLFRFS